MKVKSFLGGFDKNFCYLIWCEKTKIAAIIDPSTEIAPIQEHIHCLAITKFKKLSSSFSLTEQ